MDDKGKGSMNNQQIDIGLDTIPVYCCPNVTERKWS